MQSEKIETYDNETFKDEFSLHKLVAEGQDALEVRGNREIKDIRLVRLKYEQKNALHEVTTREADDLFGCVAGDPAHPRLMPPDATPVEATLAFKLAASPDPCLVVIRRRKAPHFLGARPVRAIVDWLLRSGLKIPPSLTRLALVFLLAMANTLPAGIDEDDAEDDDHGNRHGAGLACDGMKAAAPVI